MHRIIMNPPKGKYIDHINGNGLDNRRSNLRIVSHSQNMMNRKVLDGTKSGYKGVTFDPRYKLWQARIVSNGKRVSLGTRRTAKAAAALYASAAKEVHGEYMHPSLNKLLETK